MVAAVVVVAAQLTQAPIPAALVERVFFGHKRATAQRAARVAVRVAVAYLHLATITAQRVATAVFMGVAAARVAGAPVQVL